MLAGGCHWQELEVVGFCLCAVAFLLLLFGIRKFVSKINLVMDHKCVCQTVGYKLVYTAGCHNLLSINPTNKWLTVHCQCAVQYSGNQATILC